MTIEDIINAYYEELEEHDYFSDPQKIYYQDGYITVCLRDYNWYKTKERITEPLIALKAIFEIDFICEYDSDSEYESNDIKYSKYWVKV